MANRLLFQHPFLGSLIRAVGAIPKTKAIPDYSTVLSIFRTLEEEGIAGLFPEGGIPWNGINREITRETKDCWRKCEFRQFLPTSKEHGCENLFGQSVLCGSCGCRWIIDEYGFIGEKTQQEFCKHQEELLAVYISKGSILSSLRKCNFHLRSLEIMLQMVNCRNFKDREFYSSSLTLFG